MGAFDWLYVKSKWTVQGPFYDDFEYCSAGKERGVVMIHGRWNLEALLSDNILENLAQVHIRGASARGRKKKGSLSKDPQVMGSHA